MSANSKRRKRIGRVLVLLLASGSLLGISPLTAVAVPAGTPFVTTVDVTDSSPPGCTPDPDFDPAIWGPALLTPETIALDLASVPAPSLTRTVTVDLNFESGVDNCTSAPILPTGNVLSMWSSPSLVLVAGSLNCQGPASCMLEELVPTGAGGQVTGEYTVPGTVGSYSGTLTISWTP